jgi:hypothetical protein
MPSNVSFDLTHTNNTAQVLKFHSDWLRTIVDDALSEMENAIGGNGGS